MSISRVFLDWNRHALPQAANYLIDRYQAGSFVDMSNVVAVVPGGRAGRRLNELVVRKLDSLGCAYFPIQIITVGQLPEALYKPAFPFATQMTQHLSWARALQQLPKNEVQKIVSDVPADAFDPRWVELGILLQKQHRELAGDGLNFRSVLSCGEKLDSFTESDRWEVMAQVQQKYLDILDNLQLWDRQTARLVAIEKRECRTRSEIILVATADMNRVMRKMLDQVEDKVTSLIFAPEDLKDRFDEHGCIDPEAWESAQVPLDSSKIRFVGSPADQGIAVVQAMETLNGQYSANEITIGVPNESLIPNIEVAMKRANVPCRWGPGRSIEASRPIRLLRCVVDYLRQHDFDNLAELVRHPEMGRWLRIRHFDSEKILISLDRYQSSHLQAALDKKIVDGPEDVEKTKHLIDSLLKPLFATTRIPSEWALDIMQFVNSLYRDQVIDIEDDHGRMTMTACDAIRNGLEQLSMIPDELQAPISCDRAILMMLSHLKNQRCAALPNSNTTELLGWLELTLDDAPVKIVTNFNEGTVPTSIDADLFLPNQLRAALQIDDNRRMFARDVYAASLVSASSEQLHVIVGQRQHDGNPILPSRLLFAANHDTVLERSLKFFDDGGDDTAMVETVGLSEKHAFFVPRPDHLPEPLARMSVTDFRVYLACPYRFYLKRIWRLEEERNDALELDGAAFGSLMHRVLEEFGRNQICDSTNSDDIQGFLNESLKNQVRQTFGANIRPAVKVQIEQLRLRLHAFAKQQAARRNSGWRIIATEKSYETDFFVDNMPIKLRGRIDRIDRHEDTGVCAVLDYKSSDAGKSPEQVHQKSREWIDLQLPLYRHLVKEKGLGEVELGFVLLPNDTSHVDFAIAEWSNDELAAADQVAHQVIRDIRQQRFWPPTYPAPAFSDVSASICQDQVFDRQLQNASLQASEQEVA